MRSLIIYGTKKGTTEACAKKLKGYMKGEVEVINIKDIKDIDINNYDTVIIGSSVYAGQFIKEIKEFIQSNINKLKDKTIGLFICCMSQGEIIDKQFKDNVPEEILQAAKVKENFGGEFKFSKMNFFEKTIIKMIAKKDESLGNVDGKTDISRINENNIKVFADTLEV